MNSYEEEEKTRQRRRWLTGIVIALLILAILFLLFRKKDDTAMPTDVDTADPHEEVSVVPEPGKEIETDVPTTVRRIELPPPTPKPPVVIPEPQETNLEPGEPAITFGFGPTLLGVDPAYPSSISYPGSSGETDISGKVFTYDQLKRLKIRLLDLCHFNVKVGLDGMRLRNELISIVNEALGLAIVPTDVGSLDVVYHPQVAEIIQSINTATCEDKNPSVPRP